MAEAERVPGNSPPRDRQTTLPQTTRPALDRGPLSIFACVPSWIIAIARLTLYHNAHVGPHPENALKRQLPHHDLGKCVCRRTRRHCPETGLTICPKPDRIVARSAGHNQRRWKDYGRQRGDSQSNRRPARAVDRHRLLQLFHRAGEGARRISTRSRRCCSNATASAVLPPASRIASIDRSPTSTTRNTIR